MLLTSEEILLGSMYRIKKVLLELNPISQEEFYHILEASMEFDRNPSILSDIPYAIPSKFRITRSEFNRRTWHAHMDKNNFDKTFYIFLIPCYTTRS